MDGGLMVEPTIYFSIGLLPLRSELAVRLVQGRLTTAICYAMRLCTRKPEGGNVSVADILSSSRQDLHGEQFRLWSKAVQDTAFDLDPYTCKASYVCGMLRQFVEAAGLQLRNEYHVGALVSAAPAAELLGWCCTGATNSKEHPESGLATASSI